MRSTNRRLDLSLLLTGLLAGGCGPASSTDAGLPDVPAVDAGTPDTPPPFDPLRVHWEEYVVPAGANALWGHSVAHLPDGTALVFGGAIGNGSTASDDALIVDARGDFSQDALPEPAPRPVERWCGCATYDAARERVIVAGGRNGMNTGGLPPQTWLLDPISGEATELAALSTPPAPIGCALAYSASRRATYWFGGASATAVSNALYRLDEGASAWVPVDAMMGPTPRYDAHFGAIDGGRTLLLFAGSFGSAGAAFYSDVWRFDTAAETWSEVVVDGDVPVGRRTPWVRMADGERGFYAGFGFDGMMRPLGDLHYFDLASASWTPIELDPVPPPRGFSQALAGPEASVGVLYMGLGGAARAIGDAWVLVADP